MESAGVVLAIVGVVIGIGVGWVLASRSWAARLRTVEEAQAASVAAETARMSAEVAQARSEADRALGQLQQVQRERDAIVAQQAEARTIDERLLPLKETVESLREQTVRASRERAEADAQIREQITGVQRNYTSLEDATRKLVAAMSSGQSRGQWGEMQLEQLLDHSGLLEGTHYRRQSTRGGDEGSSRPDIVIMLPGGSEVLVDAKFPFDAYWKGIEAVDTPEASSHFAKHADDVLRRAKELSSKGYSDTSKSPDFVVMFLPLESLLQSALECNGMLLEETFQRNVILATPTTMLAMLRTIAFGFQRNDLAENAERIQELGAEMLARLGTLVDHVEKVGRGLTSATNAYNSLVGSFDTQALSTARKMRELGVAAQKPLDPPDEVTVLARQSKHAPAELPAADELPLIGE